MGFKMGPKGFVPDTPTYPLGTVFSVGDWNIGPGGGRFTPAMRGELDLAAKAKLIRAAGGTHMEFHDTEAPPEQAANIARIVREEGLSIAMCTANLFRREEFVGGNFGHPNAHVRDAAIAYTEKYISTGIEIFGCSTYVYWNGSNGIDVPLGCGYQEAYLTTAGCLEEIVKWMVTTYGHERALAIAIEPKPNEPRGWGIPANVGEALSIISLMDPRFQPFVGVNPETCHSQIGGLRYAMELGLASAAGKLFHVHLNGGSGNPKFDEDRAFGDVDFTVAVETVATLNEIGYTGMVGLDVQPLPTDNNSQQAASVARSIRNFKRAQECVKRINWVELNAYRAQHNQAAIADLFASAICGIV